MVAKNGSGSVSDVTKSKGVTKVKGEESAVMSESGRPSMKILPLAHLGDVDGEVLKGSGDLKVKFLSSSQAYLQSPGWGNGENYPPELNVWERLEIPKGKVLRIAVQHLNLLDHSTSTTTTTTTSTTATTNNNNNNSSNNSNNKDKVCNSFTEDTLSVFMVDEVNHRTHVWTACGSRKPPPAIQAARAVDFHFTTKNKTYNSGSYAAGFKLWLTFFEAKNESSGKGRPERRLPSNWPWPEFKESKAPEDFCKGEGLVWTGGMCLKILSPTAGNHQKKSWVMVEKLCRQENATLPSLNTPREWQALIDFVSGSDFQKEGSPEKLFVGLQFGNFSPPG
ncbi:hypothetical protein ACOMHN_005693 [Nucella lapillus]